MRYHHIALICATSLSLAACNGPIETEAKYPSGLDRQVTGEDIYGEKQSIFGEEGLSIFGGKGKKGKTASGSNGLAINSFLWRASLDTVSFMPLASADPFGGVILTDWYSPPETPDERFKINVFILSRDLTSDGIRVRSFKQVKNGKNWIDANASDTTARQLEDTILTRARQLRVAQLED